MFDAEQIKTQFGLRITDEEARALAEWYAGIARAVKAFPAADLKDTEPPLRSVAGPRK